MIIIRLIQYYIYMLQVRTVLTVSVTVLSYYTIINIFSFHTLNIHGFDQYIRDIFQYQLWDVRYETKVYTHIYKEPLPIADMKKTDPYFILSPGTVFTATGSQNPSGDNISWIAIRVYDGDTPLYGYILEPGGCLGLFGPYINDDKRFESFLGFREDKYKQGLMAEFFDKINSEFSILRADDSITKQMFREDDNLTSISKFIENFVDYGPEKFSSKAEYFVKSKDYYKVKKLHNDLFKSDKYIKRLTQIQEKRL